MAETLLPIVSISDFREATTFEVPPSSELETAVSKALVRYQAAAESVMRRPCHVVVTGEVVTDVVGALLVTRRRPVVSVQTFDPADTEYTIDSGLITLTYPTALTAASVLTTTALTVDYTSRLNPEDLAAVQSMVIERALRFAVREKDKAQGVKGVGEEGYSTSYDTVGWTDEEREALTLMRKRTSA
jgi:hypothetical protein